ncbi:XRE family transcriptional regulator [Sphingomonas koreensis]|nr:XRE family transcriptional regulator [Sphingomonas koreensis]
MTDFADILKRWRKTRRLSQLGLAMQADVSARHIAFLETGRARPSAAMIGRLGDALRLPLDVRNQMLTRAGFAQRYVSRQWDAEDMAPVRAALDYSLHRHDPYPALAVDRLWSVIALNAPARTLFGALAIDEGSSLLDLMTSDALPPFIENWPEVAYHAARRLRTESAAQGGVERLDHAADMLASVPGARQIPLGPVMPTIYRIGEVRLSLFSIIAQFGTPDDMTLDDLKIELYFPCDSQSDEALRRLVTRDGAPKAKALSGHEFPGTDGR